MSLPSSVELLYTTCGCIVRNSTTGAVVLMNVPGCSGSHSGPQPSVQYVAPVPAKVASRDKIPSLVDIQAALACVQQLGSTTYTHDLAAGIRTALLLQLEFLADLSAALTANDPGHVTLFKSACAITGHMFFALGSVKIPLPTHTATALRTTMAPFCTLLNIPEGQINKHCFQPSPPRKDNDKFKGKTYPDKGNKNWKDKGTPPWKKGTDASPPQQGGSQPRP
jgi:hypothetical protein